MKRGFTLLEVLVATLIFALAIFAIVQSRTSSLRNVIESEKVGQAVSLAQGKMADMEIKYQKDLDTNRSTMDGVSVEESGTFEAPFESFSWKVKFSQSKIDITPDKLVALLTKYGIDKDQAEAQVQSQALILKNLSEALKKCFAELRVTVLWSQFDRKHELPVLTHLIPKNPKLELKLE
jgi:prepilin-type N-terminal cleavage/methylation domain-containing protein